MARTDGMQRSSDRRGRGPVAAGELALKTLRGAMEKRGFAQARLLSRWPEIVGPDIAAVATPLKVTFSRVAMTGTLVLLVRGAQAPVVDMQREEIRRRVNACYGYNAIGQIALTQTAGRGLAEGQARFAAAPPAAAGPPDPEQARRAAGMTTEIQDPKLRDALSRLGANILTRSPRR